MTGGGAYAHPHVLPTVRTDLIFSSDGLITAIRYAWTYDAAYSTFVMRDIDTNKDGTVSKDELAAFAKNQVDSFAEYNYFTKVVSGSQSLAFGAVEAYGIDRLDDGRLNLEFTIPLKASSTATPASPELPLVVEIVDPNFFAYFTMAADGTHLIGARPTCVSVVVGPQPINLRETRSIPAVFWQALDGSASARLQFINRIEVTCP